MLSHQIEKSSDIIQREGMTSFLKKSINFLYNRVSSALANSLVRSIPDNMIHRYNTIHIDPSKLTLISGYTKQTEKGSYHLEHTTTPSTGANNLGRIVSGNWDQVRSPLSSLSEFKAIKQRYKHETPWTDTEFYNRHSSRIDDVGKSYGCTSHSELKSKLQGLDKLYMDIKNHGYKKQTDLGITNDPLDEVRINITRNGELLFNEQGRHRLAIARVLGLDEIPVLVSWIHPLFYKNSFC